VSGANMLPQDQAASNPFIINHRLEDWLVKFCYECSVPPPAFFRDEVFLLEGGQIYASPPAFFRNEVFLPEGGQIYAYSVIIPGNTYEPLVHAKGRFSFVDSDTRDDAAYRMLCVLVRHTNREIRDFNYLCAKLLQEANAALVEKVAELETLCQQLESEYGDSLHFGGSP
ncbi:hypothetical protein PIB30_025542, partial [Stylosanthes scabra]|nr:hypothetical protein [Stylosanthes scabra]